MKKQVDGIDRRGFLECMRWAGTGLLWTMSGGVGTGRLLGDDHVDAPGGEFTFVQISDSHIGFNKPANEDVTGTFKATIDRINASPAEPAFIVHTGDVSHLSQPAQFDQVNQLLRSAKASQHYFVPGEHDVIGDGGKEFFRQFGAGVQGSGWYSFDLKGVHFVSLVNVLETKPGGLGSLGEAQLAWLKKDLSGKTDSTPIVVFAHVPLWTVYEQWGWGTEDGAQALSLLRRFGSVAVLNGHIHQNMQKVEGNMYFHTAASTAFPQPAPGAAASPGPLKVPAEKLRSVLGITSVRYIPGSSHLAVVDQTLVSNERAGSQSTVNIDNFAFNPTPARVHSGTEVIWTNRDDIPHTVVSNEKSFQSPVLDTDGKFSFRFKRPGDYAYFCSLHPRMTGKVIVTE